MGGNQTTWRRRRVWLSCRYVWLFHEVTYDNLNPVSAVFTASVWSISIATTHWFRMICVQCVLLELVFQWNFCQHSFKGEWERCTYLVYMNWLHTQHCYELLYGHVYRVNVHLLFDLIWIKCSSKYHCVSKHLSSALTDTPYTCDDVLVCRVVSTWGVYSFQPWIFL